VGELLVVEDDAAIGGVLTRQGHEVVLTTSGADALAAADIRAFDLALIDRGLLDMDGLDVCRGLRVKQSGCVLVMLTGRGPGRKSPCGQGNSNCLLVWSGRRAWRSVA